MGSRDDLDLSELRTLSAQEVADAVGVPSETGWSAAKNGSLYGRKLGREWRFTIPAVKEWIGIPPGPGPSGKAAAPVDAPTKRRAAASAKKAGGRLRA